LNDLSIMSLATPSWESHLGSDANLHAPMAYACLGYYALCILVLRKVNKKATSSTGPDVAFDVVFR
jgi:hypothetical protein